LEHHRRVEAAEEAAGVPLSPLPNFALAGTVLAWANGADFASLLEDGDRRGAPSEGDILLALNKTLDLMAQVRQALRALPDRERRWADLAADFERADRLVRRDLVAHALAMAVGGPTPG
jgi:hypothetical protein